MELGVGYFIIRLVAAIVMILLLDGIVSKVNFWLEVMNVELIGRSSDVALFVPIGPGNSVKISDKHVMTYIKFPIII